ncbi:MAG: fibronectin type III domain-containing protein, partial [Candidatus Cryptobacteroides sp.]|nr:fibronectin type III domain-containing protein [Candidatus Cryptobacteroides sp.]
FTTDNLVMALKLDSYDETSATFSGAFGQGSWNYADKAISYGVLYSTSSSFDATTAGVGDITMTLGPSDDPFSFDLILKPATATGLSANTKYYYRAYYKVNGKYTYFDIDSFTTK